MNELHNILDKLGPWLSPSVTPQHHHPSFSYTQPSTQDVLLWQGWWNKGGAIRLLWMPLRAVGVQQPPSHTGWFHSSLVLNVQNRVSSFVSPPDEPRLPGSWWNRCSCLLIQQFMFLSPSCWRVCSCRPRKTCRPSLVCTQRKCTCIHTKRLTGAVLWGQKKRRSFIWCTYQSYQTWAWKGETHSFKC